MPRYRVALVSHTLDGVPERIRTRLAEGGVELAAARCATETEVLTVAAGADAIWVFGGGRMVTEAVLEQCPSCRVVLRSGSGVDNIPTAAAARLGMLVANTPEAIRENVAEHTVALILATLRQVAVHDRLVRQGVWDAARAWPRTTLTRATVGFVGWGRIARTVAERIRGFDPRVLAFDPLQPAAAMRETGAESRDLPGLLSEADVVAIHCPWLPSTEGLIGEPELRRMKQTAILVNTARGPIVQEEALVRALTEGWILGAGLDVLESEPPRENHPLTRLDNVVLTPHIAAYADGWRDRFWDHSAETLVYAAANGRPLWVVEPER